MVTKRCDIRLPPSVVDMLECIAGQRMLRNRTQTIEILIREEYNRLPDKWKKVKIT